MKETEKSVMSPREKYKGYAKIISSDAVTAEVVIDENGTITILNPNISIETPYAADTLSAILSARVINASKREYMVDLVVMAGPSGLKTNYVRVNFNYGDGSSGRINQVFGVNNFVHFSATSFDAESTHIYPGPGRYQLSITSFLVTVYDWGNVQLTEGVDFNWSIQPAAVTVS